MLPFVERQLLYLLASGVTTSIAWWLAGHRPALAASLRARAAVTAVGLAIPTVIAIVLIRLLDDWHSTYQFIGIAHGFYVGVLWLPLVTLGALLRRTWLGQRPDLALAVAAVLLIATGVYAAAVEPNRLRVNEYRVALRAWPQDAPALRLVHISDLQTVGPCARNRRAAEMVNALAPDLIVLTGDYLAGPLDEPDLLVEEARGFLASLRPRHGLVCIAGHSETESLRERIFAGLDVIYLSNEEVELDLGASRRMRIFGATAHDTDLSSFERRDEPGLATLFASHMPDLTLAVEGRGVDLHLAGHTHGGQVVLPLFGPPLTLSRLPRKYASGLHEIGDHAINVNAGIGMEGNHSPRFRFLCPPQIDLLLLEGTGPARPATRPD